MRFPLTQGAYEAKSIIADAQRCLNLYAEKNPPDAPCPFTYYGCPGLVSLATLEAPAPGRGLYRANNGRLYYVAGRWVYYVSPLWVLTPIGTITTASGIVSMADNGTTLVLVDGSPHGWQIDLTTNAFSEITAATNSPPIISGAVYAFYGATRVDIVDGYLLFNQPGTRNFYSTYLNEVVFDALYFAAKNGFSDNLVSVIVTRREIWLIGEKTAEIWFNAGQPDFPFQIMPGPFVQHGCVAPQSIAQVDGAVFWLSQDQAGDKIIVRGQGYEAKRISNHALEVAMGAYPTVTDAQGFCFQQEGHAWYQINFPSADRSWRWDESVPDQWHEVGWTDGEGTTHRHRAAVAAFAYGKNVCADWQTGELYAISQTAYTDAGAPIYYRRGWPHLVSDGNRVIYPGFTLDVQAATSLETVDPPAPFALLAGASGVNGAPSVDAGIIEDALLAGPAPPVSTAPMVWLRWSDDRGRTWSNPVAQSLGAQGQYLVQPQWNRLGSARDRVFEIFGTLPGVPFAVNGAFLDPKPIPMVN